ncbi:hypothetical protein ACIP96_30475 [Streptomyces nigra]|uniref:hypothetical protein n=1 Tax=Streptomyces nigra TaxID=1827580 RepID=UPI00382B8CEC
MLGYAYMCGQSRNGLCDNPVWVPRAIVEDEVKTWLAPEAAADIDAAPPTPIPEQRDERADAVRERARLEGEHTRLTTALTNLAVDRATNPEAYPEGVFEAARERILKQKAAVTEALETAAQIEAQPQGSALVPLAVGLLDGWETFPAPETNGILRMLVRRVVVTRGAEDVKATRAVDRPVSRFTPCGNPIRRRTQSKGCSPALFSPSVGTRFTRLVPGGGTTVLNTFKNGLGSTSGEERGPP